MVPATVPVITMPPLGSDGKVAAVWPWRTAKFSVRSPLPKRTLGSSKPTWGANVKVRVPFYIGRERRAEG